MNPNLNLNPNLTLDLLNAWNLHGQCTHRQVAVGRALL